VALGVAPAVAVVVSVVGVVAAAVTVATIVAVADAMAMGVGNAAVMGAMALVVAATTVWRHANRATVAADAVRSGGVTARSAVEQIARVPAAVAMRNRRLTYPTLPLRLGSFIEGQLVAQCTTSLPGSATLSSTQGARHG